MKSQSHHASPPGLLVNIKAVGIHRWLRKVIRCAYAYKILAAARPPATEDGSRESLEAG